MFLIVGLVLVAWGASLAGPFHFDDYSLFVDPGVTSPSGWWRVWRPIQTRPLSQFTFWLSFMLAGKAAWAFHLWNLVLHCCSSLLLWRTLRMVVAERAAVIAACVFAVHPMQAEVVDYVFARSAALSTLLCVGVLWLWLRGRIWGAVGVFGLALLAKEECVAVPLFLAVMTPVLVSGGRVVADKIGDRAGMSPNLGRDFWWGKAIGVMFALAVVLGARVLIATKFVPQGGGGFASSVSAPAYFTAQGVVILRYFRMLVVPWGFTVDPEIRVLLPWLAWLGVVLIVATAWRFARGSGVWILGGIILLLPSSSIFPADDLAADRRMYLPMIAFAAAAGIMAQRWKPPVLAGIGVVLVMLSFERTQVWQTERKLWQEAVERSPDKVRPRIQLARSVPLVEGLGLLDAAAQRFPGNFDIETERGRFLLTAGQAAEALGAFGRALAIEPASAMAFNNRGVALAALDQKDTARADFERALKADPCFAEALSNLQRLGFAAPDGLQPCLSPTAKAKDWF